MSDTSHRAFGINSARNSVYWFDHFLGDQLQDEWAAGGDAGYTAAVVDGETGGVLRLTTDGDASDEAYLWWTASARTLLHAQRVILEVRAKVGDNDNTKNDFAIWLRNATNERVTIYYTTHSNYQLAEQTAGGSNTYDTGVSTDTNYHVFRIAGHTHGGNHWHIYIDGSETSNSPLSSYITTNSLTPFLWMNTNEAATHYMDVDYVAVWQDR